MEALVFPAEDSSVESSVRVKVASGEVPVTENVQEFVLAEKSETSTGEDGEEVIPLAGMATQVKGRSRSRAISEQRSLSDSLTASIAAKGLSKATRRAIFEGLPVTGIAASP